MGTYTVEFDVAARGTVVVTIEAGTEARAEELVGALLDSAELLRDSGSFLLGGVEVEVEYNEDDVDFEQTWEQWEDDDADS